MKRMRKVTAIFIAFLLLMSVFTGCTKGDSGKEADSSKSVSTGKKDESDKTTAANSSPVVDAVVGGTARFGSYEQDNNTANGKEPIVWWVLSVENGRALLLSEKSLDSKPYNIEQKDVTWETCTLRAWLNSDFYNTAFNASEKVKIVTTRVVNEDNPEFNTAGGNDTDDKVFLLSYSEATNPVYGFKKYDVPDTARRAPGTDYAKSQNLNVNGEISTWWLRSPGGDQSGACEVYRDGRVNYYTGNNVNGSRIGARPALWINL